MHSLLGSVLLAVCATSALAADLINGSVRNQTKNQPASGDDVVLLRLDQGMQEEARAKTDDSGAFVIKVQFADKPHLVRVIHQGVNYDVRASAGASLTVDVYDTAPKVTGVTGNIEIIRTGTNGNQLHVSDMIEIKNQSSPPMTQAGERTFEVFLPAPAKIDSVMAAGEGRIATLISASPVPGEPGHYSVNFPLRPGSTKFAFNYDIPYGGRAAFRPRLAYPMQQLAVMIPVTMKFSARSQAFQLLAIGNNNNYQVMAATGVRAGSGLEFEISGNGAIPPLQSPGPSQKKAPASAPAPAAAPAIVVGNQAPTANNPPPAPAVVVSPPGSVSSWWILGAISVMVLGVCAFLIWRMRRGSSARTASTTKPAVVQTPPTTPLLEALKEQLLELETGRLEGSISREEYEAAKKALEGTVKRAAAQAGAQS